MAGMPIRRARRAALAEALARASDPAALAEALALAENARALPSRSTRDAPGRAGTRTQTPVAARLSAEVAGERWARRSLSVALAEEDLAWLELEAARVAAAVGRRVSAGEVARAIVRRAITASPDPLAVAVAAARKAARAVDSGAPEAKCNSPAGAAPGDL